MRRGVRELLRRGRRQQLQVSSLATTCRAWFGALPLLRQMDSSSSESSGRYCYNPTLRWNPQVEEYFVKAYGADHFIRISKALTHPSSYSCIRVNTPRASVDSVIEKLTYILRERNLQAGLLGDSKCLSIQKCQIPGLDYVLFVKGSGPHMLEYGDASGVKEVIVSRKCAEAVLRGAQVFVPGVLACSSHVEKGDLVAVSVAVEQAGPDGEWGVRITRGTVLQGLQSDPHYHERNGLYIGRGIAMMSRAGIFRALEGIAVDMSNRIYKLPSFNDVLEGEMFLQNLPSIIAAHVLDPHEGERILDMCAAPGGKTTAIAALMKNKGEIIALDRSHNKVMDILKLAEEMGLTCITAYKLDALRAVWKKSDTTAGVRNLNNEFSNGILEEKERPDQNSSFSKAGIRCTGRMRNGPGKNNHGGGRVACAKGFLPDSFDRVLLDAPCSALGLRPRLFAGEETIESLKNHANYQRRMFDQAVQLVRPGGVIVYSTCTINPGENEALVRYALDTYKFLSLASQHPKIGGPGLVGFCERLDGKYIEEWLTESEAELVQRFDPSSSLDTIGFFIAKFNIGKKDVEVV